MMAPNIRNTASGLGFKDGGPSSPTMSHVLFEIERNRQATAQILERIAHNTNPGNRQPKETMCARHSTTSSTSLSLWMRMTRSVAFNALCTT